MQGIVLLTSTGPASQQQPQNLNLPVCCSAHNAHGKVANLPPDVQGLPSSCQAVQACQQLLSG